MFPGPIVEFEIKTTARKARYHLIRVFYGLILLYFLWIIFTTFQESVTTGGKLSLTQVNMLNLSIFGSVAFTQYLVVLILTPALVSGAIADEKQRKTLHYLLTSRLSGAEIVLGKIVVRLLHLFACLAVGLPIMSMLVLMGGIDPRLMLMCFASSASTALMLAGLSVLLSVLSRKVRDALFAAYAIELAWLILIPLLWYHASKLALTPGQLSAIEQITNALLITHPFAMFDFTGLMSGMPSFKLHDPTYMIITQTVIGGLLIIAAAALLRRTFRAQDSTVSRKSRKNRESARGLAGFRHRLRPSCGNDPMDWKERWTHRKGGIARRIGGVAMFALLIALIIGTVSNGWPAGLEMLEFGWSRQGVSAPTWPFYRNAWQYREEFGRFLNVCGSILSFFLLIGVATTAAPGITTELEGDTWVSLTTSLLTGKEILRAKIRGALWSVRWSLSVVVLMWFSGLCTLSIHPVGFVLAVVQLAVYAWTAAVLGTTVSLLTRTTYRAQLLTIGGLVFINVIGQGCLNTYNWLSPQLWPGMMSVQIAQTLYTYDHFEQLMRTPRPPLISLFQGLHGIADNVWWRLAIAIASVLFHFAVGLFLFRFANRVFDRIVGRAARPNKLLDAVNLRIEAS